MGKKIRFSSLLFLPIRRVFWSVLEGGMMRKELLACIVFSAVWSSSCAPSKSQLRVDGNSQFQDGEFSDNSLVYQLTPRQQSGLEEDGSPEASESMPELKYCIDIQEQFREEPGKYRCSFFELILGNEGDDLMPRAVWNDGKGFTATCQVSTLKTDGIQVKCQTPQGTACSSWHASLPAKEGESLPLLLLEREGSASFKVEGIDYGEKFPLVEGISFGKSSDLKSQNASRSGCAGLMDPEVKGRGLVDGKTGEVTQGTQNPVSSEESEETAGADTLTFIGEPADKAQYLKLLEEGETELKQGSQLSGELDRLRCLVKPKSDTPLVVKGKLQPGKLGRHFGMTHIVQVEGLEEGSGESKDCESWLKQQGDRPVYFYDEHWNPERS